MYQNKVKRLEAQVTELSSSSADQQGNMTKALAGVREEKEQLVKEKEEVSINI